MLQDTKRSLAAAAKADRQREKTEAMRDYQAERVAAHANMARLRALRLAKEGIKESTKESIAPQPQAAERKAANRVKKTAR